MKYQDLNLNELSKLLEKREISSKELTEATLEHTRKSDVIVKSFITLTEEVALEQAVKVDKQLDDGNVMPTLAGIPMALKDNICTKDIKTTCASKMLENFTPPYNATIVDKLTKDNQAVLLGKLNMDEFAMGSSTETSYFFKTTNPWDKTKVAGGSSGGVAAAVSARQVYYAIGSDTGGSIRQPASFCGVVGLKPTYGSISRYGVVAYASSLDQVGIITRNVSDCAEVFHALAGYDELDSTSLKRQWEKPLFGKTENLKNIKIGVPDEYFAEGIDSEVRVVIEDSIRHLESLGATIVRVKLSYTEYALASYCILSCAEASSNLARFDGVKFGYRTEKFQDLNELYSYSRSESFGDEVKRRIMLGNFVLSAGYYDAYYNKALKARTLIRKDFEKAFEQVDIILSPVSPCTAFSFGEKLNDPLKMYLTDVYTVPVNLAGLPAISVPCGFTGEGMPVGMQLIGKHLSEAELLQTAYVYEQSNQFYRKSPFKGLEV